MFFSVILVMKMPMMIVRGVVVVTMVRIGCVCGFGDEDGGDDG